MASILHHSKGPAKVFACVHCQHRKIRCDRMQPCSSCVRANVACQPSTPTSAPRRRRLNQDVLDRLARCEELLRRYADGQSSRGPDPAATTADDDEGVRRELDPPSAVGGEGKAPENVFKKPTGKVVQEDGSAQFMDDFVKISFHNELTALRDIIDDEDREAEPSHNTLGVSPDSAGMFLGVEDAMVDLQDFSPDFAHGLRLWQLFVDRVNPLTKLVHIPSLQRYVVTAAANISGVPLAYQALLFSIYTMAVVSLSDAECVEFLGTAREAALNRFTKGTRLALTRANFLNDYNMTILQALALYMLSLEGRDENHSTWIMGGTVMRLAQKMGYHRDGEQFNLPPFETEMRRRIWWHILTQDSKYATAAGLSQSWVPSGDVKLPSNLDDADLCPESAEAPTAREGATEMAFVLIMYHHQAFTNKSHGQFDTAFMAVLKGGSKGPIETYRALIDDIDAELANFERRYVEPAAGGVQLAASTVRPLLVHKMRDAMIAFSEGRIASASASASASSPSLSSAARGLDDVEVYDQIDRIFTVFVKNQFRKAGIFKELAKTGFLWYIKTGSQLDMLLLFAAKLHQRPVGRFAEQGWEAFRLIHEFHEELFDLRKRKMARQAQFTLRAWGARERVLTLSRVLVEVPGFILRLRRGLEDGQQQGQQEQQQEQQQQQQQQQMTAGQQGWFDFDNVNEYLERDMGAANFCLDIWGNVSMDA
ncbi:fungal-specific transcription factor domain-containing protein [Xylaria sp. CBS 124048]|nr:fungal-specific transcription factor domain-containing protein [Xylaria sp. CBS 124048]